MSDFKYMQLAIQLAAATEGRTWPNPMVGAVVVNHGRIIGFGAHLQAGEPHAEVHALNMAGEMAKGGTLYVTLEPCSHFGRTPPCADRIIEAGITKVVVAMLDPNPLVAGKGVQRIRQSGIEVEIGLLGEESSKMNEVWLTALQLQRPFVWMKGAMTLDGKIATDSGDSKWITSESARREVHRFRNLADGILVGIGTVLKDNPKLTTRLPEGGRNPIRIVLDSQLRIPETSHILNQEANTILACGKNADPEKMGRLKQRGVDFIKLDLDQQKVNLTQLLTELYKREIRLLLVEGGSQINGSFLAEGLVDKVTMFVAPKLVGGHGPSPIAGIGVSSMSEAVELQNISIEKFDDDLEVTGYPVWKGR